MKHLLILIITFSSGQVSAQPGFDMYQHVNVQTIFSGTSHLNSAVTYSYYVDELTNLEGLSALLDHPEIKEIELRMNKFPTELIENGRHLETITIKNERYIEAQSVGTTSTFILKDTFWNCWNLNNFPNLNKVEIYGFVLLSTEKHVVLEKSYRLKDLTLHNVSFSSLAELDVESVQFWNCCMPSLINELPETIQSIGLYQCDSLKNISYLEMYKELENVTIKECNNIWQFPHKFGSGLKKMSLQIAPDNAKRVMSSITSLDHMNFVELNFLPGEAHIDFSGSELLIDTLIINGAVRKSYNFSRRPKTTIRLENYENIKVRKLGLHGFMPLDFPDIGKFSNLETLSIVNSCRAYESEYSDPIKSGLENVKGLKSFSANWDTNVLPEDFFLNNPDLEFLYLFGIRFNFYSTDIVPLLKMKKVELLNINITQKRAEELFPNAEIKIISIP